MRLSFAPGTIGLRAMSASAAADVALEIAPALTRARRLAAAPSAISAGPASVSHQFGNVVRWRSRTAGKRRPNHAWALWSKNSPVGAASWCAITTSVRSAVRSPTSATTFCVGFGRCTARRATRGPFETSSAIAAAAARAMATAGIRARGLARAATPVAAAAAHRAPISGA